MELENNQTNNSTSTVKSTGWGGARPGAGRKPGALTMLTGAGLLDALEDTLGIPYEKKLANNYLNAILEGDRTLIKEYDKLFLSKVIADRVDITSNGQTISAPTLNFTPQELPDYQVIDITPKDSK